MSEIYATIGDETKELGQGGTRGRRIVAQVRVPASTSNLGAGFDCFGLALQLYLDVRAVAFAGDDDAAYQSGALCRIRTAGEGSAQLQRAPAEKNLIRRAMMYAAKRTNRTLPPMRLAVRNEIPLGGGLGSSAAAIIAGLTLCGELSAEGPLTDEMIVRLATELEGHADNVTASFYGGWLTACVKADGGVLAVKRPWPAEIKVIVVSPHIPLDTEEARRVLPPLIERGDAVYNIQRAALFGAALGAFGDGCDDDLLWEAMRDCLHQPYRQHMIPGLVDALNTPRLPGLLGLALSGAGPSIIALARTNFAAIGEHIGDCFRRHQLRTSVRLLAIDENGLVRKKMRD